MKNLLIFLASLVLLCCLPAAGALAATHNIYVAAHGASVHNVIYYDGVLYEDDWNDGSGITSAYYSQSPASLGWSDVSFQFNLAALAGSRVQSARINFKINLTVSPDNDNTIPLATLNHYGGSQKPTGNAQNDKITGEQALQSFYRLDLGQPFEIDVTSLLQDDLAKGHQWAVFSINHVTISGTVLESPVLGAEGFSDLLIVETLPIPAIPPISLLLLGD
jgi:hypothetical protein